MLYIAVHSQFGVSCKCYNGNFLSWISDLHLTIYVQYLCLDYGVKESIFVSNMMPLSSSTALWTVWMRVLRHTARSLSCPKYQGDLLLTRRYAKDVLIGNLFSDILAHIYVLFNVLVWQIEQQKFHCESHYYRGVPRICRGGFLIISARDENL